MKLLGNCIVYGEKGCRDGDPCVVLEEVMVCNVLEMNGRGKVGSGLTMTFDYVHVTSHLKC